MFGAENDLILWLLGLATVTALVAGGSAWLMARRHGWRSALWVPVAIALCAAGLVWRKAGPGGGNGLHLFWAALLMAAPGLAGAALGLLIGARRR
jgi:hypothetical protein